MAADDSAEDEDEYGDRSDPPFKRLCARYGLAMYFVQVLEHGIVNALVWLDLHKKTGGRWTPEQYDSYYDARFSETLGELTKRLAKHGPIPEELSVRLAEANRRRRLLAHHFFREAADDVELGRVDRLIDGLESDRQFFQDTDRMLDAFVEPVLAQHGFTRQVREQALHDYQQSIRSAFKVL
ncbi:MAG TPA: hypothetical protein VFH59_05135 [Frateuria sp.]|uniref:hypothetical protein n=1 Tax=Frateuria sp. TaxID=2211372 RepID=UPI002D7ECBBA|nr:hypothetical protein [Frateuria sp.]HET6804811.1 hypothetical protein [Frateuria sp.]